ncbi:MAG: transposase [Actinomycetia bacterium]|nr:transposase [Actinomycetes bacterium]
MSAELYNACLESWRGTYRWWREHHPGPDERFPRDLQMSRYDLMKEFTGVRKDRLEWERLAVQVGRGVLCRFDRTVRSFYQRCEQGGNPGYPRFKPSRRWRTIEIPDAAPSMLSAPETPRNHRAKWWKLQVKGLPRLRFRDKGRRLATALEGGGKAVMLRIVRTPLRTELQVVIRHPDRDTGSESLEPSNPVGVDKGLSYRLTLSDGTVVAARVADMSRIKRAQGRLSRSKKRSRSRRKKALAVAKAHRREQERATQADFRLAHRLVSAYDGIAVEDLNVAGLLRTKRFSRKMSEQRWAALSRILEHKAEKAGVPFVRVNPKNTTTDCSQCGHRQTMPLSQRTFHCQACGLCLGRDHNAAINIGARAFGPGSGGTTPDAMRPTNLRCNTDTASGRRSANGHRRTVSPSVDKPVNPGI